MHGIILPGLALICGIAHSTGTIMLKGGEILPRQRLAISLDKLIKNISYEVTCKLTNPSATNIIIGATDDSPSQLHFSNLSLNQKSFYVQASLKPQENSLHWGFANNTNAPNLLIINADQLETIRVENCVAEVHKGY